MRTVYEYASTRHGVLSDHEAIALGLTRRQICLRVSNGQFERIAPRVLRLGGAPETWQGRARAAALSVDGLISHRSAAFVHGIDGFTPNEIEVTVPKSRRPRAVDATIHRSTQSRLAQSTHIDSIPTTGIARTVLDVASVVSLRRLEWTIDSVLRQQLCGWTDLVSALACHSIQGRNGCGPLRAVLDQRSPSDPIPDSTWNRMVGQLLTSAGLPSPQFEFEARSAGGTFIGRIDLAYPQCKLAIELDSMRWHMNRESFERDPRRKNKLLTAGWAVLSFTWSDYADRPSELVRTVRDALHMAA